MQLATLCMAHPVDQNESLCTKIQAFNVTVREVSFGETDHGKYVKLFLNLPLSVNYCGYNATFSVDTIRVRRLKQMHIFGKKTTRRIAFAFSRKIAHCLYNLAT